MKFKIHPLYILLAGIYILMGQGYIFICYFLAVVLHELAHLFTARKSGVHGENITLYPFGGEVKLNYNGLPPYEEVKIALSGPLFNLLIASLILSLNWLYPSIYPYSHFFYTANLFNAILNLIPVYPLDGGRVLCALLQLKFKRHKAISFCMISGYVFSAAMLLFGIYTAFLGNFSYITLAPFLLVSQIEMKVKLFENPLTNRLAKKSILKKGLKLNEILVHEETLAYKLFSMVKPDCYCVFHIVNDEFDKKASITEQQLSELAVKNDIYVPIKKFI